jgi:hypothetical protein
VSRWLKEVMELVEFLSFCEILGWVAMYLTHTDHGRPPLVTQVKLPSPTANR